MEGRRFSSRPIALTALCGLYAALALLITWPLARLATTHIPLGSLDAATVPYFNLWTLSWNADRLAHGLRGYWDAPIFYPVRGAFALSEPQPLPGALFALLRLGMREASAYNGVLFVTLVLNGFAGRYLLRASGVSAGAAALGGGLAVCLPFALKELGVLQLLALYGPLCAIAELGRLFRGESGWALVRLALSYVLTLYACVYLALLLGICLGVGFFVAALGQRITLRPIYRTVVALALLGLSAAPLLIAQRRALAERERPAGAIYAGSASLYAYARLKPNTLGASVEPWLRGRPDERALYPGTALLVLAAVGVVRTRRSAQASWVWLCSAMSLLAVVLSFGTRWNIFGFVPYESLVQRLVPGFGQLRSPYRFSAMAELFLLVPAGYGLMALLGLRRRALAAFAAAVLGVALFEPVAWPAPLVRLPVEQLGAAWVRFLHDRPQGAVAMVPPQRSGRMEDYEPVTVQMLQALRHGHPLCGGYSGFFPESATRLRNMLLAFPEPPVLVALVGAGARYVVVDAGWAADHHSQIAQAQGLQLLAAFPDASVYALQMSADGAPTRAAAAH